MPFRRKPATASGRGPDAPAIAARRIKVLRSTVTDLDEIVQFNLDRIEDELTFLPGPTENLRSALRTVAAAIRTTDPFSKEGLAIRRAAGELVKVVGNLIEVMEAARN